MTETKVHLELVAANPVNCVRLNDGDVKGTLQAMVHSFKNGTTAVLCEENSNGTCNKNDQHCTFEVNSEEKLQDTFDKNSLEIKFIIAKTGPNDVLNARKFELVKAVWLSEKGINYSEAKNIFYGKKSKTHPHRRLQIFIANFNIAASKIKFPHNLALIGDKVCMKE